MLTSGNKTAGTIAPQTTHIRKRSHTTWPASSAHPSPNNCETLVDADIDKKNPNARPMVSNDE